jgi:hypothetical protein
MGEGLSELGQLKILCLCGFSARAQRVQVCSQPMQPFEIVGQTDQIPFPADFP